MTNSPQGPAWTAPAARLLTWLHVAEPGTRFYPDGRVAAVCPACHGAAVFPEGWSFRACGACQGSGDAPPAVEPRTLCGLPMHAEELWQPAPAGAAPAHVACLELARKEPPAAGQLALWGCG
jgi:hypothetical protein